MSAGYCTALLHVTDVERSIRFYQRIGFHLVDSEGDAGGLGWARMHTEDGSAIMFLCADEDVDARAQGIMLVLYTPDLPALREQLLEAGENPPAIEYPPWMPSGSLMLRDPDGYGVNIHHWSDKEHTAWLAQLEQKRAAGVLPPLPK
jgi:catechol 2,3-dioxygenase-like lactoylglutathione lyase family enzyme